MKIISVNTVAVDPEKRGAGIGVNVNEGTRATSVK